MNKITNEQLDGLIKSAVNSSGPLPPDEKFSQIISALRELRELRAALLQGKAEPVQGWIPCSERMPEGMIDVITSNGVDTGKGWWDGDNWKEWNKHDAVPVSVTHWMPLPAAPQQEVK